uniref:Putative secreted peptide n=1 Tax=Anopheles braziliensis TaxID=58242 RepID=A0A2M3ZW97_9DIPT
MLCFALLLLPFFPRFTSNESTHTLVVHRTRLGWFKVREGNFGSVFVTTAILYSLSLLHWDGSITFYRCWMFSILDRSVLRSAESRTTKGLETGTGWTALMNQEAAALARCHIFQIIVALRGLRYGTPSLSF